MSNINPIGTIYANEMPTVLIHSGMRGARGLPGEEGDPGPVGDSINLRGTWQSGGVYAALDGVTWRSSALDGVDSLYLQISAWPTEPSTTEPSDDPARWMEVGLTADDGLLGGVWLVTQPGHGFTKIGTPISYSTGVYTLASAAQESTFAVALVREVVDENTFILQSTGGIPQADPSLSMEFSFTDGVVYYLSTNSGKLTSEVPTGSGQLVQEIYQHGTPEGIVLPWKPVENSTFLIPTQSLRLRYYYTATGGQTVFSGPDDNLNTPDFTGATVEVFQNGLNLQEGVAYTHDLTSVTLSTPAATNDLVEIWSETAGPVAARTRVSIDALTFDGVTSTFPLNVAGTTIAVTAGAVDLDVYLDGNPQQPEVDYTVADNGGQSEITFATAPETETGSWLILITE